MKDVIKKWRFLTLPKTHNSDTLRKNGDYVKLNYIENI